jgi:flagellar hook-associated protein 2
MTGKKEGKESQIDFPDFYFLDGSNDFYFDDGREAQNAKIQVDGFPIETKENSITDFLPGVNLQLKQAREGQPFSLTISQDHQKIAGKVKGLVDQINQVLGFITKQNQIDEKTDTSNTFAGDTGLQTIEYRLRNLLHEGFPGTDFSNGDDPRLVFLNQIGVEFDRAGQLSFKEDKFTKALEGDFDGISTAITGPMGFAFQIRRVMNNYTNNGGGMLSLREQGLRSRIKDIDNQIDQKARQLDRRQTALTEQYSRLESTLANLQRQQQYLSATLPSGGGGNLVQQLLGG